MPLPILTYAFRPQKKIKPEFRRIVGEIAARGRGLARLSRGPADEAIHEARLLIKRLRALLWFAQPALDAERYGQTKTELRKAAGLMSGQRDFAVIKKTLADLAEKAKPNDHTALKPVARHFVKNSPVGATTDNALRRELRQAMGILGQTAADLKRHASGDDVWPSPDKRLAKAFHATRRAEKKARRSRSDADFHAWRKKAKRLLYLLELTEPKPARSPKHLIKRVAKLQDSLGLIHDCAVVQEHLGRIAPALTAASRILSLLAKKKAKLEKKAVKIARKPGVSLASDNKPASFAL